MELFSWSICKCIWDLVSQPVIEVVHLKLHQAHSIPHEVFAKLRANQFVCVCIRRNSYEAVLKFYPFRMLDWLHLHVDESKLP